MQVITALHHLWALHPLLQATLCHEPSTCTHIPLMHFHLCCICARMIFYSDKPPQRASTTHANSVHIPHTLRSPMHLNTLPYTNTDACRSCATRAVLSCPSTHCVSHVSRCRCACTATLIGHEGEISKVAFSPQGSRVLTASGDKTARVWDVDTGDCLQKLEVQYSVAYTAITYGTIYLDRYDGRTCALLHAQSLKPVTTTPNSSTHPFHFESPQAHDIRTHTHTHSD
jgi:WD40 repeat protein